SVLSNLDYPFRKIWIRGFQRGLSGHDILVNLLFPVRLMVSLIQSFFLIKRFKPDLAIGTGGYTAGPPLRIAAMLKIPIFLHEQNVFPGKTTRMLSKHAKRIYSSFEDTKEYIKDIICFGTPLRRSLTSVSREQGIRFFELKDDLPTVFIFGGSQGSRAINNYWITHLSDLTAKSKCQFIWQTGQNDYEKIKYLFAENPNVYVTPFIHEMGIAYSAADIIISRAGALTLAELCLYAKPSILIPLPTAAGNHQEINARIMEKEDASFVVLQKNLESELLEISLQSLIENKPKREQMSENAKRLARLDSAKLIVDDILKFMDEDVR
ncbi:MAG: UDP-N-acetylglucosamine--N-acetylmuramyl-(pentapeptide) pyrophosphoryl-undecaprenol N-acetylglucosamine transferase, partial [Candidatus Marinimicrobia bacterium]|nr:UDP-N-acetylglucosamine--N-acetylmuramyl-(pentapeptide) pyrophosphoryl-undecaprenol N-acetylglucosamine transferase [Candidatus Neomarinimicrobiota bacterium]